MNLVEQEIQSGIPSDKIFIGGFSQGGATALYTALISPKKFAGVIALSTWLPVHHQFPSQLVEAQDKFKTPILSCHGDIDPMVPHDWAKLSVAKLKALGFTDVSFNTYQGLGHSSVEQVISYF